MSQTKKFKYQIIFLLMMVCFFMFGCENKTPVEDISFNLNSGEQIVLIVGQTLELDDYVVVKPSYATNKKYTVTSFDESVVKVENNKLVALKEATAVIKVVSKDNALKECMMTVVVKAYQEQLSAPLNFSYDSATQTFSFDPVLYASSYTLRINGEELSLGNSTIYNMSQYSGEMFDNLLIAQVKANAPAYSYALKTSSYSNEFKVYQAGPVSDLQVRGGVARFNRTTSLNACNVYLGEDLIAEELTADTLQLTSLDEKYAGASLNLSVEAVVSNSVKEQYGEDVQYFNSTKQSVAVNVLDAPNLTMSASQVSWQNIAHAVSYSVLIDEIEKTKSRQNYFNLKSMADFETVITSNNVHEIKVVPLLAEDGQGVAKTTKVSTIKVQRLETASVSCDATDLVWNSVENASVYSISLMGEDVELKSSTSLTNFSMRNYLAGEYTFEIVAVAQIEPSVDGVYYLSSKKTIKTFLKHESLVANIKDYVLNIENLSDGTAILDFDVDGFDKTIIGIENSKTTYDLSTLVFDAGSHSITLTRLGDANSINSDACVVEFVQLEKIDTISIASSIARVSRSQINENAKILLKTEGSGLTDAIMAETTSYSYNSTNSAEDDYLLSGTYTTKVFVAGDGSSTFSYRENGEVVACASINFEVLSAPTSRLLSPAESKLIIDEIENASSYKIYKVVDDAASLVRSITTNEFSFTLNQGTVSYSVQAVGDGQHYLTSVQSNPIEIVRLETPTLSYNNSTNVISKTDTNSSELVQNYVFTHNGVDANYDFVSPFVLADEETGNVFTLMTEAVEGVNGVYYLNSKVFSLNLSNISSAVTMSINGLTNNLLIYPAGHKEEFSLIVEFDFGGTKQIFSTKINEETGEKVLSNGLTDENEIVLPYSYRSSRYYIQLIDENHNAIVEEMNNEFSARVKFIKPSTGNDALINSEFSESVTLNLNRINSTTNITLNTSNQLVLTPTSHSQEFGLVVKINGLTFVSNEDHKLVCESYELPYVFRNRGYQITLLNDNYEPLISSLNSNFDVQVQYVFNQNASIKTDLDSDFSETKTILVQTQATITRDGQNLKISNIKDTYTYLNYTLLVNNYPISLNDTAVSEDGFIVFDVEYIYSTTPKAQLQDVNLVEVLVKNIDTTADVPIMSRKGGNISIKKTDPVVLSYFKYNNNEDGNNNNSTVVSFETYETSYEKEYVVEIYSLGNKVYDKHYRDGDASDGIIAFNMDDIAELAEINGLVYVTVNVHTAGVNNTVNMFNSVVSNRVNLNKITAPSGLLVMDNILYFNRVNNAVGYEIYEKTGVGYTKLNEQLITANSYNLETIVGTKSLVVKAISRTGNYTNSSFSEVLTVNKVEQPTVSVVDGKFQINFSLSLVMLMMDSRLTITPEVVNGSNVFAINLDDLDGEKIKLINATTLIAEPYAFLSYNKASLQAETIELTIKIQQTEPVDGVYYLNSNTISLDCYGLFEPSDLKKTTNENDYVEMISWKASDKNILNNEPLSVGYIFKIEYFDGVDTVNYYSSDENLKYYDATSKTYKSYPTCISGTSALFPAGYGLNEDGTLQLPFGAGSYKFSVQSVPLSKIDGYNLCSSKFSASCEFMVMPASVLTVAQGKVAWNVQDRASHYIVSIYEQGSATPLLVDTTSIPEYDFTNSKLNNETGVYKVIVKAISTREDTLNSAESDAIFVYRLPQATAVSVDDGHLILSANRFFSAVTIELVDTITNSKYILTYDNTLNSSIYLNALNIETWEGFTNNALIETVIKYSLTIDNDVLKILDGRDYTINVLLSGNSGADLGMISSVKTIGISNITTTKLKPNAVEVSLGVVQFMPDAEYATISQQGVYSADIDLNYSFNGATSSGFWKNTVVYKIVITTAEGEHIVYAVDYYSLTTAINNGSISSSEYQLLNGLYGLHSLALYNYDDNGTQRTLYFNVFQDNKINLRDYDKIIHYSITETMIGGVNKFSSNTTSAEIDLVGTIDVDVFMLGGDSCIVEDKLVGHLSAQSNDLNPFERYGRNELSTTEGKVQFNNLTPVIDGNVIDNPVYKIVITSLNAAEDKEVYYIYHTTEDDAKTIAMRHDENYQNATYLQVGNLEGTVYALGSNIVFDLSKFVKAGTYRATIRTLAGLGNGSVEVADYYINAKEPTVEYTFFKLTDTQFFVNDGVLSFEQSYIVSDGQNIPCSNYEITLIDDAGMEHVYVINEYSEGVNIDTSLKRVSYVLPATIIAPTGTVVINGGKQFDIKVRALATDNYVLNGTYKSQEQEDVVFTFEKSLGLSELGSSRIKIENGILKWKVLDLDNYKETIITVSFLDENNQPKNVVINIGDLTKVVEDGVYQYHYHQFSDDKYNLATTGSTYIKDKDANNNVIVYSIYACTKGVTIGDRNIINSNLSSVVTTTRLSTVDEANIRTEEGLLVWDAIENAASYEVILVGNNNYTFKTNLTTINLLDEEYQVEKGSYSVQIKAIGSTAISSMMSDLSKATGFIQLDVVDINSVEIQDNKIVWNSVENADAYKIEFEYTDLFGEAQVLTEITTSTEYVAPNGISGLFSIRIAPVSVGLGKEFNAQAITFTSSSDAPLQVEKFEYDATNSRLVIEVKNSNFLTGDKLLLMYNFAEYIQDGEGTTVLISELIYHSQAGMFEEIDEEITRYYYPIKTMGKYTSISVQVTRAGTVPSNAISITDIDLNYFAYGDGSVENPYRISNAQHLLNIDYFDSANYVLISSINMANINIEERLNSLGALVADNFSGVLDGANFSIFGFDVDDREKTDTIAVENAETFALFGALNNATIKNLTIGTENIQLILLNTFAKSIENVVNLSLIATGANNSIIDNINVINFKMQIQSTSAQLTNSIYVGGLIGKSTNGTIKNSKVNFAVEFDVDFTNDVYVGGIIAEASNTNLQEMEVSFGLTNKRDNTILYVGGAVAYFTGNIAKTTGLSGVQVANEITNIKSMYHGGLVGFARYVNIDNSSTSGTFSKSAINYQLYLGGLVGTAQSSTITNSGSDMVFNISVSTTTDKYIGAIAGDLTVINSVSGAVTNCYMSTTYQEQTEVTTSMITLGLYGYKDTQVSISGCFTK